MKSKNVLVAYATLSGSTSEVASAVAAELRRSGSRVDFRRLQDVSNLESYDLVVIGAPMILGWHREAMAFIKAQQKTLSRVPVAYFVTAMSLTKIPENRVATIPVCVDPLLAKAPRNPEKFSRRERYSTPANYLHPALIAAPLVRPVSVGFFGGKMDYHRLSFFQRLFARWIIGAPQGDFRNWDLIREWASGLAKAHLGVQPIPAAAMCCIYA